MYLLQESGLKAGLLQFQQTELNLVHDTVVIFKLFTDFVVLQQWFLKYGLYRSTRSTRALTEMFKRLDTKMMMNNVI